LPHSFSRRARALALSVAAVALLAFAPGALAATLAVDGSGNLVYTASPDTQSMVAFDQTDTTTVEVTQAASQGDDDTITPGDGCVVDATGTDNTFTCTGVTGIVSATGLNMDDTFDAGGGYTSNGGLTTIPVNFDGGDDNDHLFGGAADDVIHGGNGDDEVMGDFGGSGSGSNDQLFGDAGSDSVAGGKGNDTVDGGADDDNNVVGGPGNDTVTGGTGDDGFVAGGPGDDNVSGGDGNDYVYGDCGGGPCGAGAAGNDTVNGDAGNDSVYGEAGADTVNGGSGDDSVYGDCDGSCSVGADGNDTLNGDAGDDSLNGGGGDDVAHGGDGNDSIDGDYSNTQNGADQLFGDAGDDNLRGKGGNDAMDGGDGADSVYGGKGNDLVSGGAGDDYIDGATGNDTVDGGAGDDYVSGDCGGYNECGDGADGNDTVLGGAGSDYADADGGTDTINLGSGIDQVSYPDRVYTCTPSCATVAYPVSVTLDGVANDGGAGENDNVLETEDVGIYDACCSSAVTAGATIIGDAGVNALYGGSGNDIIDGGAGNDFLYGYAGDDTINANDGFADRVDCGDGNDTANVDEFDQVADNCETVNRTTRGTLATEDAPPTVAWSAPASGAKMSTSKPNTLTVTAADDKGISQVVFLDGERILCVVKAAPYTCSYSPTGDDVGRDTLTAIAYDTGQQTASAVRVVTVGRFAARSLSAKTSPRKDSSNPFTFTTKGKLTMPAAVTRAQGCKGKVTVTFKAGKKTISSRTVRLSKSCSYRSKVKFTLPRRLHPKKLRVLVRFRGNAVLGAKSHKRYSVKTA
jgi:Ca2+-binding RTX toxin-like protein